MEHGGKCHVATFGCRVNQADSEGILQTLAERDLKPTSSHADADVVVINSCTVTHRSDADIRKLVNRVHRENPSARVVVAGCYAQREPQALVQLSGTSAVLGNSDAHRLGEVLDQLLSGDVGDEPIVLRSEMSTVDPAELPPVDPVAVVHDRTRPFVKIQDGCDANCTYCVIPEVRGRARSADPAAVVRAVRDLTRRGYFEVVLTGIHLGTYGVGLQAQVELEALVRMILDEVPELPRLRMSCIEPMAFPLALADIARDEPRMAPHFHLPLQSGHDRVLKRMARPYRAADFAAIIEGIRARVPHACIGTDVIVGFPGETDEEFDATCAFCESVGFDYIHVFSYSDRPGVPSTRLKDKVDPRFIKARSTRLNAIGKDLWRSFLDRQVDRELDALSIQPREGDATEVLSDTYCPVRVPTRLAPNTPVRVRVTRRDGDFLRGELVEAFEAPIPSAT